MGYGQQYPSNGYGNYMNPGGYNQYQNPNGYYQQPMQYQQPQPQQTFAPPQPQAQPSYIEGKVVESIDILRVTEVPMGKALTCPKADFSEVYVKSWNPNGTTKIVTYRPVDENAEAPTEDVKMQDILDRLTQLDVKIDKVTQELGTKRRTS